MNTDQPLRVVSGGRPTLPACVPKRLTKKAIESRVIKQLRRLDAQQVQVVELVIAAIARGAR